MRKPLEEMTTQELIDYIEDLEAQLDVLHMDFEDVVVPDVTLPELTVSEQTADLLAEAAELFDNYVAEPAAVEDGVVRLEPVTAAETYIPVTPKTDPPSKTVKVKVKRKV